MKADLICSEINIACQSNVLTLASFLLILRPQSTLTKEKQVSYNFDDCW